MREKFLEDEDDQDDENDFWARLPSVAFLLSLKEGLPTEALAKVGDLPRCKFR